MMEKAYAQYESLYVNQQAASDIDREGRVHSKSQGVSLVKIEHPGESFPGCGDEIAPFDASALGKKSGELIAKSALSYRAHRASRSQKAG